MGLYYIPIPYDVRTLFQSLTVEQQGIVFMAALDYGAEGIVFESDDPAMLMAFRVLQNEIDRKKEEYDKQCARNAANAKKRWENRDTKVYDGMPSHPTASDRMQPHTTASDGMRVDATDANKIKSNKIKLNKNIPPISPKGETREEESPLHFETFWKVYPRHQSKQKAIRAWKKLKVDEELLSVILKAIERTKKSDQWQRENGRYIPLPASWLNGRRWEDEDLQAPEQEIPDCWKEN